MKGKAGTKTSVREKNDETGFEIMETEGVLNERAVDEDRLGRSAKKVKFRESLDQPPPISYRSKLLQGHTAAPVLEDDSDIPVVFDTELSGGEEEDDDMPRVRLATDIASRISRKWGKSLIVKLMGRILRFESLVEKLTQKWNPTPPSLSPT
ncbi:hypothetical protein Ancab_005695 [Ancistrocladus abbreviatus]